MTLWLYCSGFQSFFCSEAGPSGWIEIVEVIEISFNFCIHIGYAMMRSLFENQDEKDRTVLENKSDALQKPHNHG